MAKPRHKVRPDGARPRRRWLGMAAGLVIIVVIVAVVGVAMRRAGQPQSPRLATAASAPDGEFTTITGQTTTIAALRGQPALVWFVVTSCGSCAAGTQAMAQHIDAFAQRHVKVVELELADNLGAGSTDISRFGRQQAGAEFTHPSWVWGTASQALTTTYDPEGYLDVYYLLDARGKMAYVNSAPDSTMSSLLEHVNALPT